MKDDKIKDMNIYVAFGIAEIKLILYYVKCVI